MIHHFQSHGRLADVVYQAEKRALAQALLLFRANRTRTAQYLGQSRRTIIHKIDDYQLHSYAALREAAELVIPEFKTLPITPIEAPVVEPANTNE